MTAVSARPAPRVGAGRRAVGRIVVRRLIEVPIVLLLISIAIFWLVQVVPGDPARSALGQFATADQIAEWKRQNNLDGSTLERYLSWLGGFVTGNLGTSLSFHEPVASVIWPRFGNTLALGVYAFLIIGVLGIAVGLAQAARRGGRLDRIAGLVLVSVSSIPEFATGSVLLVVLAVAVPLFPVHSSVDAAAGPAQLIQAMTLPALTLAAASIGYVARMVRAGTIVSLESPFYRTAVLEGVTGQQLVTRHLLRNSLVPSIAVLGGQLAYVFAGNVVVETLFSFPGIGATIVDAVQKKDLLLLESSVMVTAATSVLLLLIVDLVNMAIDPRIDLTPRSRR